MELGETYLNLNIYLKTNSISLYFLKNKHYMKISQICTKSS